MQIEFNLLSKVTPRRYLLSDLLKIATLFIITLEMEIFRSLVKKYQMESFGIVNYNCRVHKGDKERGEVKEEYGEIWGEEEENADYGEWCNPASNMLHHVWKGLGGG